MKQDKDYGQDISIVGRVVHGKFEKVQKMATVNNRRQPVFTATGRPSMGFSVGIAVLKPHAQSPQSDVDNFTKVWNAIHMEAAKMNWHQPYNYHAVGFSWKVTDGDAISKQSQKPFPDHHRGCVVVNASQYDSDNFSAKLSLFKVENGQYVPADAREMNAGDYVQIVLNIRKNDNQQKPGIYISPKVVALLAKGERIESGYDPSVKLGGVPQMPSGMIPQAPQQFVQPMGSQIGQAVQPGMQYAPPPQQGYQQPVQPNHAVLPQQFQPQAQPQVPNFAPQGGQPMGNGPQVPIFGTPTGTSPMGNGYPQAPQGSGYAAPGMSGIPQHPMAGPTAQSNAYPSNQPVPNFAPQGAPAIPNWRQ